MERAQPFGRAGKKARVKTEKAGMDLTFLILVLLLLSIGLIMLFSASYAYAYYHDGNSFYYISRQLFFAIVGVIMMLIISRIDYHILHRLALPIFAGTIFLLIFALVFPYRSDAKRWINLGFTTFQPSELAKFALVVLFAHLISINYEKMKDPKYGVWPFLGIMGVIALLMLLEPHLSGTILIVSIGIVMMFVGGTDIKWFMLGGGLLIGGIIVMVLIPGVVEYAESRFIYWINPWDAPQGAGYQTIQSLYAIGSG
ncbi:FtsW/RodA/SpoVE family cell cycle protein, partial [Anaerotruncus rubiinfantis]